MKLILTLSLMILSGCSISKPCSEAGDITWNPVIVGDKKCHVTKNGSGKNVLTGAFQQEYFKTHTLALEGQYEDGRKTGIWIYYGLDTKVSAIKFFDKGVEKTPPAEAQKKIDLLIIQKNGSLDPKVKK